MTNGGLGLEEELCSKMQKLLYEMTERMKLINSDGRKCVHDKVEFCPNHSLIKQADELLAFYTKSKSENK